MFLLTRNESLEVSMSNRKPKEFVAKMGLYDPYFQNRLYIGVDHLIINNLP